MRGVSTAYYLVHSMASGGSFAEEDRLAARAFAEAARGAGVGRIVYLGGLGGQEDLSSHLASRQEVGRILRHSGVPTLEFRASIIIGSGSLSFEMIRALVDRLPVMITPQWVRTLSQPIAVEDVIAYLVAALELPSAESRVFEIGGRDRASYADIMKEYARQRGLRRAMIPVPFLSPRLSGLVARPGHPGLCPRGPQAGRQPQKRDRRQEAGGARPVRHPAALAPGCDCPRPGERRSSIRPDPLVRRPLLVRDSPGNGRRALRRPVGRLPGTEGRSRDRRRLLHRSARSEERVGWYAFNWLWRLRGWLDLMAGGPGLRRGRKDPERPAVGETIDFWRVEAYEPDRLLRLSAEMRLPGRAWLQFEVESSGSGSVIRQTAEFEPLGLAGLAYWYGLYPLHRLIFEGMLRRIAQCSTGGETVALRRKEG